MDSKSFKTYGVMYHIYKCLVQFRKTLVMVDPGNFDKSETPFFKAKVKLRTNNILTETVSRLTL